MGSDLDCDKALQGVNGRQARVNWLFLQDCCKVGAVPRFASSNAIGWVPRSAGPHVRYIKVVQNTKLGPTTPERTHGLRIIGIFGVLWIGVWIWA